MSGDAEEKCPIPATHDKLREADYFLGQVVFNYHNPLPFQYNLNGFIQAVRNITFMLQSEDAKPPEFAAWYEKKQGEMKEDPLLRRFVSARNIIVKQTTLKAKSKAWLGLFRDRTMKLAINDDIPPLMDTEAALEHAKKFAIGFILDEEHSAIGEQIGVERTWIVEEIGEGEVVSHCVEVLNYMRRLVGEAHELAGSKIDSDPIQLDMRRWQVLLESDVDPSLVEKWGW
jgi:hypothetical protein